MCGRSIALAFPDCTKNTKQSSEDCLYIVICNTNIMDITKRHFEQCTLHYKITKIK